MDYVTEVAVGLARNPKDALWNALRKLSFSPPISSNVQRVVIKPSFYNPASSGSTSPDLLHAVVRTFNSVAPIYIVESDNPLRTAEQAFPKSRCEQLKTEGAHLVNLSSSPHKSVPGLRLYAEMYDLPELILYDRFFVNIGTLKTDSRVVFGAGIKNLFDLIPIRDKTASHDYLEEVLLDILYIIRPNLTILDLTDIVAGPRKNSKAFHVGGVLVGHDPVAVDAIGASLLGLDPLNLSLLRRAHELGLGEALPDRIRLVGTEHQKTSLYTAMEKMRIALAQSD